MSRVKKFLNTHIVKILDDFQNELVKVQDYTPLDLFLRKYMKTQKNLGSHDRSIIQENVYGAIKHKIFLDAISKKPVTWQSRVDSLYSDSFFQNKKNSDFPM